MQWPDGFMWGTGASSNQAEGAAPASNWWDWERAGKAPVSGDGNGFATRYAEDFATLAALGLDHHRLSIEWARVEPEEGVHDEAMVAHYRAILQAALDAGVEPWVTLHHFTLPRWFAEAGGFTTDENRTTHWARHVDWVADTFGDLVRGWKPVNEVNFYPVAAYAGLNIPPGLGDPELAVVVSEQLHLAAAEAAVRLKQTGAPVSSIFALMHLEALDDKPETLAELSKLDDVHWQPGVGLQRDGVLRIRGREPIERPDLAGAYDLYGFSYYASFAVRDGAMTLFPEEDGPSSPIGYKIWADGLDRILRRLHELLPGQPILIAEYGVGTPDDALRAAYLERGLAITHEALADGIDIRGFFHWTAVDNYEWIHGYDVEFGIIDRDRNIRPSAQVLKREARQ
ncbi:family 1 glycosylhydrolase [Aquihabitans sp. McL0605]|uniref:family 1 glycosylhydrolase n=1 Tax=Aquihabitans sp. McL0605 TaxID=3415671 RepID=UPI003CF96B26